MTANMDGHNSQPPLIIPAENLSEEALFGVIDNFIVREGTDYGIHEVSYETKQKQLMGQINKGELVITFDPHTETVSLMTRQQWKKLNQG